MKTTSPKKKKSSNQLFSNLFNKNVAFTNFLSKKWESKYPLSTHCECGESKFFIFTWKKFREINLR